MSSSIYKQFLAAPNPALLSADATLHYITTTTTICGADNIIKHLGLVSKQIKKNAENVIEEINGRGASMLELETVMEFVASGGPYAPGLDDNFLADRTVSIPITHIVRYDENGRIAQIRLKWDQGAMLKELEIISKSGRNWPIRDNRDQLRLISNCLKATAHLSGGSQSGSRNQPSYDEYTTPQKQIDTRGPVRAQDVRHWDNVPGAIPETPVGSKPQPRPRRDAEKHFEIEDDGSTPVHREAYGPDMAHRQKADFQSTYTMTDDAGANTPQGKYPVPTDRQKAVDNMGSSWEPADHSPVTKGGIRIAGNGMGSHREANPDNSDGRGIHIGGDGMGGPKGTKRDWLFGGDEESPERKPAPRVKPHNKPSDMWQF